MRKTGEKPQCSATSIAVFPTHPTLGIAEKLGKSAGRILSVNWTPGCFIRYQYTFPFQVFKTLGSAQVLRIRECLSLPGASSISAIRSYWQSTETTRSG